MVRVLGGLYMEGVIFKILQKLVLSFIVVYIAVYFAWSRKKREAHSNVSLFVKTVSLFKKM